MEERGAKRSQIKHLNKVLNILTKKENIEIA